MTNRGGEKKHPIYSYKHDAMDEIERQDSLNVCGLLSHSCDLYIKYSTLFTWTTSMRDIVYDAALTTTQLSTD